jgi:hypothetical protein
MDSGRQSLQTEIHNQCGMLNEKIHVFEKKYGTETYAACRQCQQGFDEDTSFSRDFQSKLNPTMVADFKEILGVEHDLDKLKSKLEPSLQSIVDKYSWKGDPNLDVRAILRMQLEQHPELFDSKEFDISQ